MTNTTDTSRAQFEAWIAKDAHQMDRNSLTEEYAWQAWQAARAQPTTEHSSAVANQSLTTESGLPPPVMSHNQKAAIHEAISIIESGEGYKGAYLYGKHGDQDVADDLRIMLAAQADHVPDVGNMAAAPITQPLIAEAARDDACWCNSDRLWNEYPIGTKARESWSAGHWLKTDRGWKWHLGSTFPTPGAADQVLVTAVKRDDATGDAKAIASSNLTDKQIEVGWHQTFSTNNPYCPCNLKSFTKAVRWTLAAIAASKNEGEV